MSGMLDYVAEAIRLLRDQADAVHELHNAPGETTFEGEPEAEAAYAELERVANGLETEIAARLRGDGKQGQAVAWIKPDWSDPKNFDGKSPVTTYPQLGWTPLYIHPQSAPSEQVAASDMPPPGKPFVGYQCPSCGEEFIASAASVAPINNNKEDNAAH